MLSKSIESDFSTLNWIAESEKICSVHAFQGNSSKYSYDQRGKLDWNWPKLYEEKNRQDSAPLERQATNNQTNFHNFKTRNWIYLQLLSLPF